MRQRLRPLIATIALTGAVAGGGAAIASAASTTPSTSTTTTTQSTKTPAPPKGSHAPVTPGSHSGSHHCPGM